MIGNFGEVKLVTAAFSSPTIIYSERKVDYRRNALVEIKQNAFVGIAAARDSVARSTRNRRGGDF